MSRMIPGKARISTGKQPLERGHCPWMRDPVWTKPQPLPTLSYMPAGRPTAVSGGRRDGPPSPCGWVVCGRGKGPCASVPSRTRLLSHRRAAGRSPFTSASYAWWYAAAWSGPGAAGGDDDATSLHAHPARTAVPTQKRRNRWVASSQPSLTDGSVAHDPAAAPSRTRVRSTRCHWYTRVSGAPPGAPPRGIGTPQWGGVR